MRTDSTNRYIARRQKLFEAMPNDSVMILTANSKIKRNGDAEYPYRQDSNFYYVSGFIEDKATLVFFKKNNKNTFMVFCHENNPVEARWQGPRLGVQEAKDYLKADAAYSYSEFDKMRPQWEALKHLDPGLILNELRLIKDEHEIELMRKAAQISAQAHIRAMKACKAGLFEYELEAEYLYEFTKQGARSPAYTTIVGAGANACILHYIENQSILKEGQLVLADAGAEYQHYAADITRVFPVGGRFSEAQKTIYELVLKSQLAAIDLALPNQPFDAMQTIIVKILGEGLVELGIIKNAADYKKYYMHNSGHWLGMDVHDVGAYQVEGKSRLLKPGMVLTVEPGLYFPEDAEIDEKWRGIGIRIEDDILVTENEPEILSKDVPKTIKAIEQLMQTA